MDWQRGQGRRIVRLEELRMSWVWLVAGARGRCASVRSGALGLLACILAGLLRCDDSSDSCADISGAWRLTVRCSELVEPEAESWEQNGCQIVRRASDLELGLGRLDSAGVVVMDLPNSLTAGAECRGTATSDRVQVDCPTGAQQTCGPDSCCILRWDR